LIHQLNWEKQQIMRYLFAFAFAAIFGISPLSAQTPGPNTLLNVSYDVSRELFVAVNQAFVKNWKEKTGQDITVNQSHAGSSQQARSVLEGLEADVVTFNQVTDIQILHDRGKLIPENWQQRLPNASSPYFSLPTFLVRAGNPKGIKDWDDLVRADVKVVFPNPKTSGNARYTYLAAYAYAQEKLHDASKADEFIRKLFLNVPVFDTGGRGATTTFVEREVGDVLITFESETNGIRDQFKDKKFEVIVPSVSLLAEFPVTLVDKVVDKRGSRAAAAAYLDFLYSVEGQTIAAQFYNRVVDPKISAQFKDRFPNVRLIKVEDAFGGWANVNKQHLASGAKLDTIFAAAASAR
jgi:sulfate transport system substrate-binding protein